MKKIFETLYKIDNRGKVREWRMEQDGANYRTVAGLQDGKQVTSKWTEAKATNVGRANERDPVAQATSEIESEYEYNLKRTYHRTVDGAAGGAHFFEPMLAEGYNKSKQGKFQPGYGQPKLDGIRSITKPDGLWSREGEPILGAPHIHEILQSLFVANPDLILDGELYNHEYKDDFESILSAVRQQKALTPEQRATAEKVVQYHVYDMPSCPGKFSERSAALKTLIEDFDPRIVFVETRSINTETEFDDAHAEWLELGYEGSMLRIDGDYEKKRTHALLKRKEFIDEEFEVVRIEEGKGNWSGAAKRVVCRMADGREFGAGIKGSYERGVKLLHETHKVVTIKYFRLTSDGLPRMGVAIKFHGPKRTL